MAYKRGKIYWYDFWKNGERYQGSTGVRKKADAELIEAAKKTEIAKALVGIKAAPRRGPVPRFTDAMKDFLAWAAIEHEGKSETTRRYSVSSKSLIEYFSDRKIDSIDGSAVEDFKDWRRVQKAKPKRTKGKTKPKPTKQVMPATVNRELACLKAFFFYWIRRKVIFENPVSNVKMLAEKRSYHVVTPEEERDYLAEASQPLYDIASMILETGMRPEEVYGMKISDIRLKEGYYFNKEGKTPSAQRRVPLTRHVQKIIIERLEDLEGEYLFPGNIPGKPIVKINAAHSAALRRAKLPRFRLYDFRHTFATRFVEAGGDLVTLAQILGHSDLRMVMIYSHPTDPHKQQSIRKLEAYNHGRRKGLEKVVPTIFPTDEDEE